ncbi:MAG: integrase core domain-containing protein [Cyanobacteria bacterium J06648_11]
MFFLVGLFVTANDAKAAEVWSSQTRITNLYPSSTSLFLVTEYSTPLSTCDNGSRFEIPMSTHWWMIEYNEERPHDALGDLTPMEARQQIAGNSGSELSHRRGSLRI